MIDISKEQVLPLTGATKHVPRRRRGRPTHVATLYRWSDPGLHGIRLEVIQCGGTLCTSLEALQRFFNRLTAVSLTALCLLKAGQQLPLMMRTLRSASTSLASRQRRSTACQ
jgi:Protein of unknown function (DUF1580)